MEFGRSIKIYLSDGSPSGLRHVEIANWSGQAIACSRSRFSELQKWEEAKRPGVYFLLEKHSTDDRNMVYIGESENAYNRICEHDRSKDFWSEVIIFTSKDENLTKSHVKYLESRLIRLTDEADRYNLENKKDSFISKLPRADIAAMEEYIHNCKLLLGVLGHRLLEPLNSTVESSDKEEIDENTIVGRRFEFSVNGVKAYGKLSDEGFLLLKGSHMSIKTRDSLPVIIKKYRDKLISENTLIEKDDCLVLEKDIIMSSASYAAALVAGTARSGPQSWKDENGRTMKSIEEELIKGD